VSNPTYIAYHASGLRLGHTRDLSGPVVVLDDGVKIAKADIAYTAPTMRQLMASIEPHRAACPVCGLEQEAWAMRMKERVA